jgi:hypothetical protein
MLTRVEFNTWETWRCRLDAHGEHGQTNKMRGVILGVLIRCGPQIQAGYQN